MEKQRAPPVLKCGPDCWLKSLPSLDEVEESVFPVSMPDVPIADRAQLAGLLYTPLHSWQTRILQLLPGLRNEPLQCYLHIVDMILYEGVVIHDTEQLVSFTALSYAWGKPQYTQRLAVNSCFYPITPNLASALHFIRSRHRQRLLWVDAVCINQHNDDERSAQVGMMLSIYQKAERVVAWLGLPSPETRLSFSVIGKSLDEAERPSLSKKHESECLRKLIMMKTGFQDILSRAWFRRTWVRQEVFGARSLSAHCGDNIVSWELLSRLPDNLQTVRSILSAENFPMDNFCMDIPSLLSQFKKTDEPLPKVDLLSALTAAADFEESDPKDKVYGILGMTGTPTQAEIAPDTVESNALVVDYKRSLTQVYQDITKYLINRHQSLLVLFVRYSQNQHCDHSIPSWTPDWRSSFSHDYKILATINTRRTSQLDHEAGRLYPQDLGDNNILRLEGHHIYVVDGLGTPSFYIIQELKYLQLDPETFVQALVSAKDSLQWALDRTEITVPHTTRTGDWIVTLSQYSTVLRPMYNGSFRLVGPCLFTVFKDMSVKDASFNTSFHTFPKTMFVIE